MKMECDTKGRRYTFPDLQWSTHPQARPCLFIHLFICLSVCILGRAYRPSHGCRSQAQFAKPVRQVPTQHKCRDSASHPPVLGRQSKVAPLRPSAFPKNFTDDNDATKTVMRSNLFGSLRLAILCTPPASPPQVERRVSAGAASWKSARTLTKDSA